ncbi:MAG: TrkH family potassium uptake protein [Candidatus Cryptobacteroides sp.]
MNIKVISKNVGLALLVSALFMFLSMIVSVLNGMDSAFGPLSISFIITFVFGAFPFIFVKESPAVTIRDGYVIILVSWVLSFIFGMLPYVLWGGEFTLINAWFESVSGYTTTGSTILNDIEVLPKSLLFWRSSTHFIGGLGVVVFLLLILPNASPFRLRLTNIEVSSLSREGYRYRSGRLVRVIVSVYVGLAVVETVLLVLAGMSFFDAVNHAFSTVATGGFSTKNASVGFFSPVIQIIIMVFMMLAATHFGIIYSVFATKSLKPLRHPVVNYYYSCILVLSIILVFILRFSCGEKWGQAIMEGFFNVITFITTTGFAISDNNILPSIGMFIILFASIQCGMSGSTTGGLKADRVLIFSKAVHSHIYRSLHPSSVSPVRVGNHPLSNDTLSFVGLYITLYMLLMFISTIMLSLTGIPVIEAITGTIASLSNVGPGFGEIGSLGNYASQPVFAKIIYTLDMFLGRIEIFPVMAVLSMIFNREK